MAASILFTFVNSSGDTSKNPVGTGRHPAGSSAFSRLERMPPLLLMVYIALVGIGMLFATLLALYVATRLRNGLPLGLQPFPRYFSLSTIVLLVSSYTLGQAPRLYRTDDLAGLARCLGATLLLGCIFSGLQVLGWFELRRHGLLLVDAPAGTGTFVYFITALHVAHVVVGLGVLLANLLRVLHAERDAVRALVFIRNPYHRRQLQALGVYWHFIDALWVLLFVVFLF